MPPLARKRRRSSAPVPASAWAVTYIISTPFGWISINLAARFTLRICPIGRCRATRKREAQRQAASSRTAQAKQNVVQKETVAKVQELCGRVGHSLSRFVLNKYAGATEPGKVGFAKLTIVFEKLTDIAKGINRLRKAAEMIGEQRYAAICREMSFASESIDDIPHRDALKVLLARVEAEAARNAPAAG
jgi:hypothetical protein